MLQRRTGLRRNVALKRNPTRPQFLPAAISGGALEAWFAFHLCISEDERICQNCKAPLQAFWSDATIARSHQAHILPKELFPSVATHLDNHILLGGIATPCGCHVKYDFSWERASRMDVIGLAKARFVKFQDCLTPEELKRLPAIFLSLIEDRI